MLLFYKVTGDGKKKQLLFRLIMIIMSVGGSVVLPLTVALVITFRFLFLLMFTEGR